VCGNWDELLFLAVRPFLPVSREPVDVAASLFATPSWVVIAGGVVAVLVTAATAATVAWAVLAIVGWLRRAPRCLDPTLGFDLHRVDLATLRAVGRAALARSASGRELTRRLKLVDRVLAGETVTEAARRAGVPASTARQWLGLYLDSQARPPRRRPPPCPGLRPRREASA
jgi:hypothetical protein